MDRLSEAILKSESELSRAMKTKEDVIRVCEEIEEKQQEQTKKERPVMDDCIEKYIDDLEAIQTNLNKAVEKQKQLKSLIAKAEEAEHHARILKAIQ